MPQRLTSSHGKLLKRKFKTQIVCLWRKYLDVFTFILHNISHVKVTQSTVWQYYDIKFSEFWGSHVDDYEDSRLVEGSRYNPHTNPGLRIVTPNSAVREARQSFEMSLISTFSTQRLDPEKLHFSTWRLWKSQIPHKRTNLLTFWGYLHFGFWAICKWKLELISVEWEITHCYGSKR